MLTLAITVFLNGNIYTNDPARPRAEALVVRDGAIVYVGSNERARVRPEAEKVEIVDLGGRTVVPGLTDAHGHLGALGALERGALDLRGAQSWDDVIAAVKEEVARAKPGAWILGSRWDHESWPGRELPSRTRLDEAAPANPVLLDRVDGHMAIANARALDAAGLAADAPSPEGGKLDYARGLLTDNAIDLVARAVPAGARGSYEDLVLAAQARCLACGLTCVHDAGLDPSEIAVLRRLADEGRLKLRVYGMVAASAAGMDYLARTPPLFRYGPRGVLSVRCVKVISDGAMGSRGAWLLAPYADAPEPGWAGFPVTPPGALRRIIAAAAEAGYQVAVHAIGDRANREVLEAFARPGLARPRVEHAQLLALDDIPRFFREGAIASMQPTHATSDMRWAERRVGRERLAGAYAWATLLRSGARLALGSDFPVETPDPLAGIHAAITRCDASGSPAGGWLPGERLSREEALHGFTDWAAYAAFEEDRLGRLAPGFAADFTVLDRDILTCAPAEILATHIALTVVAGEVAYRRR